MNRTKLIELLKTFSPPEFKEFGKFVHSPLHNESLMMITLYNSLRKHYPDFSSKRFTREKIYYDLYEDLKYDDKKLRDRFSDMYKLAEDYLSWLNYRENPVDVKRNTLMQFSKRNLGIDFNKKFKEIEEVLDKIKIKNELYFYSQHEQFNDKRNFYETRDLSGKRKLHYDDLSAEIDNFTLYFISKMLSFYVEMYNREAVLKYDFQYRFYEPVMEFLQENNLDEYPTIKSYYLTLMLVKNKNKENEKVYLELKAFLIKNIDLISLDDKKLIFTELFNYALNGSYKEIPLFIKEQFEIMKLQLKYGTYPTEDDKWIDLGFYFNYVIISSSKGLTELGEKFIEDYTDKLNPLKRENGVLFVRGILCFARKEYDPALKYLSEIKGGDFQYYIRIKTLMSKIYFEQKEYENVLILIDSFKHYMSSNPMIPETLNRKYSNFISMLNKLTLLTLKPVKDEYNIHKFVSKINDFSIEELTSNKLWLLEKAKDLGENSK